MNKIKIKRYEALILDLLNYALLKQINDPLLKQAIIQYVKLSADKSVVKVYLRCYEQNMLPKLLKKIRYATGFFRNVLAQNLPFRKAPYIVFLADDVLDRIDEIESVFAALKQEKNNV